MVFERYETGLHPYADASRRTGITQQSICLWRRGKTTWLKEDTINKILTAYPKVDSLWLQRGAGQMEKRKVVDYKSKCNELTEENTRLKEELTEQRKLNGILIRQLDKMRGNNGSSDAGILVSNPSQYGRPSGE